jgi:hypothetical protein
MCCVINLAVTYSSNVQQLRDISARQTWGRCAHEGAWRAVLGREPTPCHTPQWSYTKCSGGCWLLSQKLQTVNTLTCCPGYVAVWAVVTRIPLDVNALGRIWGVCYSHLHEAREWLLVREIVWPIAWP